MRLYVFFWAIIFGLLSLPLRADTFDTVITKGIVCDTIEDAIETIDNFSRQSPELGATCGFWQGAQVATVTTLHPYENDVVKALIAKIDFTPHPVGVQYGWVMFEVKKPPDLSFDL